MAKKKLKMKKKVGKKLPIRSKKKMTVKSKRKSTTSKKKSKKVAAVPKGYNSIIPYLMVSNGDEAIQFYKKVFGAKEVMRSSGPNGKVGHAELQIGDSKIMLSDMSHYSNTVAIHLYIKDVDKVMQTALSFGAKLIEMVSDKFYGDRSGMVEDPFGHRWNISTHTEDLSIKEVNKRAAAYQKEVLESEVVE